MTVSRAMSPERRQIVLCRIIGAELCEGAPLKPLTRHSGLHAPPMPLDEIWLPQSCDARMIDVAWGAVVQQLRNSTDSPVIDHQWSFGFADPPHEPWGFVTEPYLDLPTARALVLAIGSEIGHWGVDLNALDPSLSSWNPGACVPIVATLRPQGIGSLVRHGMAWALGLEVP